MLRWACCLILAGSAAAEDVTIYTRFAHPPSALSVEFMKGELDVIMAPLPFRFEWRSLDDANGRVAVVALMVVTFRGDCQTDDLPPLTARPGALGWTHMSGGEILPFADVDCNRIRDLISHSMERAVPQERARILGRAMGRVLAHELYHYLLRTSKHASSGIAKPYYTSADLVSPTLRFALPLN